MVGVDLEAGLGPEPVLDILQDVVRQLDHDAACLAHGVMMHPVGEVVHGSTMAEVHVHHDAELLERLERPVHRRQVHLGCCPGHSRRQLVGCDVLVGREERTDDGAASERDADAHRA